MTTPNPDAEVIEKLALEIYNRHKNFHKYHLTPYDVWDNLAEFVIAREQAAVNAAIRECAEGVIRDWESPLRNGKPGPIAQSILSKLK